MYAYLGMHKHSAPGVYLRSNAEESALFFQHVGAENRVQVIRLDDQDFYLLGHLACPAFQFLNVVSARSHSANWNVLPEAVSDSAMASYPRFFLRCK